ncbi:MAG: hypothetical protein ABW321_23480, partial [Polyangiales bacterium]
MNTLDGWIASAERATSLPRHALYASALIAGGFLFALAMRAITARFVREIARLVSGRGTVDDVGDSMSRHRVDVLLGRGAFWIVVLLTL